MSDPRFSRREFLGLIGSATFVAGCSKDRGEIVPFTKRPEGAKPGVADFYASTFQEGLCAYGVLVKTREGRPIHVQGNDRHPAFKSKTSPAASADIMGLYDPDRLKHPLMDGHPADWSAVESKLVSSLKDQSVLLVTGALLSPARRALIMDLKKVLPGLRHVSWEPALGDGQTAALQDCYGSARRPRLRLERAKVIVALEADLLSGGRTEEIGGFASNRTERSMNRLYAFEGSVSLTGANADVRVAWRPSRAAALGFALARELHQAGVPWPSGVDSSSLSDFSLEGLDSGLLRALVGDLKKSRNQAVVVAGPSLPPQAHAAAFLLNAMLGAEGHTVDASSSVAEPLSGSDAVAQALREAQEGKFGAAIFWQVNPAYSFPDAKLWKAAVAAIPLKVRIGLHEDETAQDCELVLPEHHWLESWNDFETAEDLLSLQQPAVGSLYETKQAEDILLDILRGLGGGAPIDYRHYLMARWQREVQPSGSLVPFESFWSAALHDGVCQRKAEAKPPRRLNGSAVNRWAQVAAQSERPQWELLLSPSANLFDGRYANNGWLQELPDPVTKLSWGNAVSMSPTDASRLSLEDGQVVRLSASGREVELPVVVQPGQAPGVLSAALGYGRRTGSIAQGVGANLFPLWNAAPVAVKDAGRREVLAFMQRHHTLEGRDVVRSLAWPKGRLAPRKDLASLYEPRKFPKHKWVMAVDLSLCVGCQACVLACQSENNIPTVGKERVLKGREMHWMRVDRYYEGSPENPRILMQPMLCQQCDDAPCENVCPVAATNHSDEGLNEMAYNRCVGTRYCQNNCPYKVRRFNFFEYTAQTPASARLAFNPEVTVRPRGVMEKCTFCVQRIQEAKQAAKVRGRPLQDGDIEPACAAACPARAIVFGDLKDSTSRVSKLTRSERGYRVLEELGVKPSVTYLADLRNPPQADAS